MAVQELIDKLKSFVKGIKVIGVNEEKLDTMEKTEICCMDFVDFELTKKLKDKGFPQVKKGTLAMYNEEGEWYSLARNLDEFEYLFEDFDYHDCVCPTISQVLTWLRKEKKIYVSVEVEREDWFEYKIVQTIKNTRCNGTRVYETYPEAILAGIEYVLDNLI